MCGLIYLKKSAITYYITQIILSCILLAEMNQNCRWIVINYNGYLISIGKIGDMLNFPGPIDARVFSEN